MVIVGAVLIVRMIAGYGLQPVVIPGVVLGALIAGLGVYRLRLIAAARRDTRQ